VNDLVPTTEIPPRKALFMDEAERFTLRFRCRDCVHVVPSDVSCSMLFPNKMLRDVEGPFQPDGAYAFCKYFELGEGR